MHTIIASGPVIIENNKVLLVQHGDSGKWKFPGGTLEEEDFKDKNTLEKVCHREVKEELGLDIEIIKPLKPIALKKDESTRVVLIHFLATRLNNTITPGKDIEAWNWFDIHKLPEHLSENIEPVIETYENKF